MKKNFSTFGKMMASLCAVAMLALTVSCGEKAEPVNPDNGGDGTEQGGDQGGDQGGNQGGNQGGDQGGNQGGDGSGNTGDGSGDGSGNQGGGTTAGANYLNAEQYGFEETGVWYALNSAGKFLIVDTQQYAGSRSLKYTYDAAKAAKEQSITANPAQRAYFNCPAGSYELSMMMKLDKANSANNDAGISVLISEKDATPAVFNNLGVYGCTEIPFKLSALTAGSDWVKFTKKIDLPAISQGRIKIDFNAQFITDAVVFIDDIQLIKK